MRHRANARSSAGRRRGRKERSSRSGTGRRRRARRLLLGRAGSVAGGWQADDPLEAAGQVRLIVEAGLGRGRRDRYAGAKQRLRPPYPDVREVVVRAHPDGRTKDAAQIERAQVGDHRKGAQTHVLLGVLVEVVADPIDGSTLAANGPGSTGWASVARREEHERLRESRFALQQASFASRGEGQKSGEPGRDRGITDYVTAELGCPRSRRRKLRGEQSAQDGRAQICSTVVPRAPRRWTSPMSLVRVEHDEVAAQDVADLATERWCRGPGIRECDEVLLVRMRPEREVGQAGSKE